MPASSRARPAPRRRQAAAGSTWQRLAGPQRIAAAAAIAILAGLVTEIPSFGWIDGSLLLTVGGVLRLMVRSTQPGVAELPFHDGTLTAAAGIWIVLLALFNTLDGADPTVQLVTFAAGVLTWAAGLRHRVAAF